ncbi:MAG: TIGR02266 family protein [Myxococcales bacterium]|nr:TIGR02266 family protein [Myxococcales bacterium]
MANQGEHPREFPRFEVEARVDYTGTEILLNHRIQNLSLGGLCIQTDALEDVGTPVDLVINFPELDTCITARGEVVWANPDTPMDLGIRFVGLDNERKETLRKYLALGATSP